MLFIFCSSDFKLQYADKDAVRHFNIADLASFKLFDIHSQLNTPLFTAELADLCNGRSQRIEKVLKFDLPENGCVVGKFDLSIVKIGNSEFIEVLCESCSHKNVLADPQKTDLLYDAERRLVVSERTMASIIELAVDGVVIIDSDGIIQGFNRAAEKIFGYSCSETLGQNVAMLMPEPHRTRHNDYIARYLNSQIPHIIGIGREVEAQRKNGQLFPIDLAVAEVRLENGSLFTGFIRDLSERKKFLNEQKLILEELQAAKSEAERSSQAKSFFIAKMNHELRTPLNSIIGFSRHLLKNSGKRFADRDMLYLDRIRRNGETLLKLINSVLDYSRSEAKLLEIDLCEINLAELLAEIIDLMQVLLEEKQVILKLMVPENCLTIQTDPVKLRQIIQNIIDNAVKFSDETEVLVELIVDPSGFPVQIDITDSGPGIDEDKLEFIFAAFQQADNRVARKYGGAGLGLSIARSFAELLGINIKVKSSLGHGARFSIVLPRGKVE